MAFHLESPGMGDTWPQESCEENLLPHSAWPQARTPAVAASGRAASAGKGRRTSWDQPAQMPVEDVEKGHLRTRQGELPVAPAVAAVKTTGNNVMNVQQSADPYLNHFEITTKPRATGEDKLIICRTSYQT